ncbi:hypothetical protein HanOQP8_Chr03g0106151 [Helianthus annuus]|nr:hypothetical protein HanLR1_Chr03g0098391 [Helianthus annuus]KAJ0773952.1 hypothetical protein HanOQP8_Chr03g0106151 [Helianthus annuus]KAJ0943738.1 hypothetical protein HanPSC8_Chr03g0108211 [Helianthus annuus]
MLGASPVATGGALGQVRLPGSMLSFAGRGGGEWHPAGTKKTFLLICRKTFIRVGTTMEWVVNLAVD